VSKRTRQALRRIARDIRKNSPIIRKKLRKAGVKPDPALVFSAAKFYRALNKLAKA
jgi:phenylacetate-coenzyme A ligase PaaK-like adenylate-forming protein